MRTTGHILLALFLLAVFQLAAPAMAQDEPAEPDISRIERLRALQESDPRSFEPEIVPQELLGEEGVAVQRRALAAYYQYRIDGYEHRQRVFRWQLLSSRIIFVVVIFLVLVGIYFSWLQFSSAIRAGGGEQRETTFEASTSGFKVSSPVLGVIILAISLAFFYLYLAYVYPIVDSL